MILCMITGPPTLELEADSECRWYMYVIKQVARDADIEAFACVYSRRWL